MMRRAMNDSLLALIYGSDEFNGAAELLTIFTSIVSGFSVPLKDEHIAFFKTIIIPLHKVQTSNLFFEELMRCSMLFLSKDRGLAIPVMRVDDRSFSKACSSTGRLPATSRSCSS
eukprot:TRINITY_DN1829_c0_g3_i1.p1 TRINITY_DN1829_c0_g3~~TRINITY_DN1829_c0_g3_i1.p1  ORF type:complete len:115 (-),score=4.28 TRINITY_DN1829_c0_g3_i1:692-1036(-)